MVYEKLVLFDVDGTILKTDKSARGALSEAIKSFTGKVINLAVEDCAGKTDFLIVSNALKKLGFKPDNGNVEQILNEYISLLDKSYNHENSMLYPGIMVLLESLDKDKSVLLGLLTGNIKRGVEIKLQSFDILGMFKLGAYGDDGFYREELPVAALKKAECLTGISFSGKNVVVIGDTASDVDCGKVIKAKTIAVCRKKEFLDKIRVSNPDFIFFSTENHARILEAIYQ